MRIHFTRLAAIAALGFATPAWAQSEGLIGVEQPWARASIMASRPAAAYFTVVNRGDQADTLVGLESPIADRAEVHQTIKQDDVMKMAPAGPVEVPAGGEVRLEPGGLHVMLMELERPIREGETIKLTLRFANAPSLDVSVPVMGLGAKGPENE
ncbi:copper chaperone PCu(A)C [Nitratireductor rhodophyticola]|uniref:copper chaperone PCu(A)C n=1 Tax=Nitratireductor rhodophyticola TaxID=2854036 RepID=UPI00300BAB84